MSDQPADEFFLAAFDPSARANPYPLYASYRERTRFIRGRHTHLALGHAECSAVLRDARFSSDERHSTALAELSAIDPSVLERAAMPSLLGMDPPDHTRLRGLVMAAFTPSMVERIRPRAETITRRLIDHVAELGGGGEPVDLVKHLALPLPVTIICELLGVPPADHAIFGDWAATLARSIDPGILRSPELEIAIRAADHATGEYLSDLLDECRKRPGDDLLSALVTLVSDGERLSHDELVSMAFLLLIAGFETTVNLIGNGTLALLRHPDQFNILRNDPNLTRSAVDELLRFDSPVQFTQRVALDSFDIAGNSVSRGDQVMVVIASANRDPHEFDKPDTLDLRRDARRHLAFGAGIHHCLGSALARTEGAVAIEALTRRYPNIALAEDPPLRDSFTVRGPATLHVTLNSEA